MSVFTIPKSRFDWLNFAASIICFSRSRGADESFPIIEDGKVILDIEELTLADDEEIEDIPFNPIERLKAGFDLFALFAMWQHFGELVCADDKVIEVPDLDGDEDDEHQPLTTAQRRLVEKTECDECRSYGFQISLEGSKLVFQSVLMSESDGDCEIEEVADAGLVEKPMAKFINSFIKKPARRKS